MEAHLVHYNKKYMNIETATNKPDGLAVVALFLQTADNCVNEDFSQFANAISRITRKNSFVSVSPG